jgi:hypothetical protein
MVKGYEYDGLGRLIKLREGVAATRENWVGGEWVRLHVESA